MEELDLLRDVARAAAYVKAEADHESFLLELRLRAEEEWSSDEVDQLHQSSLTSIDRHLELLRTLARLAKVSPELVIA